MTRLLPAIYEHGRFKTTEPLKLSEHQRVLLAVVITHDEIPSLFISKLAETSKSFKFLNNPKEDIYSPSDGEEV